MKTHAVRVEHRRDVVREGWRGTAVGRLRLGDDGSTTARDGGARACRNVTCCLTRSIRPTRAGGVPMFWGVDTSEASGIASWGIIAAHCSASA